MLYFIFFNLLFNLLTFFLTYYIICINNFFLYTILIPKLYCIYYSPNLFLLITEYYFLNF